MKIHTLLAVAALSASVSAIGLGSAVVAAQAGTTHSQAAAAPRAAANSRPSASFLRYTEVARLQEPNRRAMFAELTACHVDVKKKAESQSPEMKMGRGYSPRQDMKMFRERSRFENAGNTACEQRLMQKHALDPVELREIKVEGICKQWPPLTGKPGC
jgi:hypothetical protein